MAQIMTQRYILYSRELKSGKKVFYYVYKTRSGRRSTPRSTGIEDKGTKSSRRAAENHIQDLLEQGLLSSENKPAYTELTIKEYTKDWFIWNAGEEPSCPYIRSRLEGGYRFSRRTADDYRRNLVKKLWPALGDILMTELTAREIEECRRNLKSVESKKDKKQREISNRSKDYAIQALRVIFTEAYRLGDIPNDPNRMVRPIRKDYKAAGTFTRKEADTIIATLYEWGASNSIDGGLLAWRAHSFMRKTGVRVNELCALRWDDVDRENDVIYIRHNYSRYYGGLQDETKTSKVRMIPLEFVKDFLGPEGFGAQFIFPSIHTGDSAQKPVSDKYLISILRKACENAGIDWEGKRYGNHSWRHYLNAHLAEQGFGELTIQTYTGHETKAMTQHYSSAADPRNNQRLMEAIQRA